jgi:branched-chain amino acid transport system permease protein
MKSKERRIRDSILTLITIVVIFILLYLANQFMSNYQLRILNLCGIYIILSLSMILINGFLGLFSLGHAGFMAIGAYTVALLTLPPMEKQLNYYLEPIVPWLANTEWSFLPAILLGGVFAAIAGLLIGAPVLRLKDDYLAIATLGFAEIIRIIFTNLQSVTNGSLGLKGLPKIEIGIPFTGLALNMSACIWIAAVITVLFMVRLVKGSYGKAFLAIREDEIAAEAMGINVFKHKLLAFVIASFFAGIGGAFLGNIMGTVDPLMFRFLLTYNIVLIVVFGGIGSLTGGVLAAIVITAAMEMLRFLDSSFDLGPLEIPGIPGVRMVVFSLLLMFIIIFKPRGIMGVREFSWQWLIDLPNNMKNYYADRAIRKSKAKKGCDQ